MSKKYTSYKNKDMEIIIIYTRDATKEIIIRQQ